MSTLVRRLRQSGPVRALRSRIPDPIKSTIRAMFLFVGLHWVGWSFQRNQIPSRGALTVARLGWGNSGWPADSAYLQASCELLRRSSSDALECGSGLSTVVFALALRDRNVRLLVLEHSDKWFDLVTAQLARFDSRQVQVVHTPLVSCGDFDWYTVPPELEGRHIGVVICDGPPGTTRGGRYGLLPVMASYLASPTTILLDDSAREGEKLVLQRWAERFETTWVDHEEDGFSVVTARGIGLE